MLWQSYINGFRSYLQLEKSLSAHSVGAYIHDVELVAQYFTNTNQNLLPKDITTEQLQSFLIWLHELNIGARSQMRIISGIRAFYKYLSLEDLTENDPTQLLDSPKIGQRLPVFLTIAEIEKMLQVIDRSKPEGERNRAIIETLYGCGLRVSELTDLRLNHLFFNEGFIRVVGKGDKERLVPIGHAAANQITLYIEQIRKHQEVKKGEEDIVFLNRRGTRLSRVMIFKLIKQTVKDAGITKTISPHTLRHSFATHLVQNGADLRAVQEMLGHESILTTEIYTHLDQSMLRKSILQFHPLYKDNQ